MLGLSAPDAPLRGAIKLRILQGKRKEVVREMARACPRKWELVVLDHAPLPEAYTWAFPALTDLGEKVWVVFRPRHPSEVYGGAGRP